MSRFDEFEYREEPIAFADGRVGAHMPGCLALRNPRFFFMTLCTCSSIAAIYRIDFAALERRTLARYLERCGGIP